MNSAVNNGRSLAAIVTEMKEELKDFLQTRLEMLKREMQEKLGRLKIAAPLAGAAVLLLLTAYLLITSRSRPPSRRPSRAALFAGSSVSGSWACFGLFSAG